MQVYIPASVMVGIWKLDVRCGLQDVSEGRGQNVFADETECYILFNPWCKGKDYLVYRSPLWEKRKVVEWKEKEKKAL